MNRRTRVLASTVAAAAAVFGLNASAYAASMYDTGMITVTGGTRAVRVAVGGADYVSVNKVSDPGVQVRVSVDGTGAPLMTIHQPGENQCSAADDLAAGTLNRTITLPAHVTGNIYVKVQYATTTPMGVSTTTVIEPLGASGLTIGGVNVLALGTVLATPVDVCVA
jgi:hypothetical protein